MKQTMIQRGSTRQAEPECDQVETLGGIVSRWLEINGYEKQEPYEMQEQGESMHAAAEQLTCCDLKLLTV